MSNEKEFKINKRLSGELLHCGLSSDFKSFCEIKKANLGYTNLRYANLRYANLRYADLSNADLGYTDLRYADLNNADLSNADLRYADLSNADLRYADLSNADLSNADLRYADLSNADLSNAKIPMLCKWNVSFTPKNNSDKATINSIDINTVLINIGCKSKTILEWDSWFKSNEVFETNRDSFEFYQIKGMYLAYKAYLVCITSFEN